MDALGKLGFNAGLFIAYLVNVILLLFLLRRFAYQPILKMLDTRRARIAAGLESARKAEQALASAEVDKQALLDEARVEAQRLVSEAHATAEAQAKLILANAKEDARKIAGKAEEAAKNERDRALSNLREQIATLSIAAASHLLGSKMNDKQARAAIKDFFVTIPAGAKGLGDAYTVVTAVPLTDEEQAKFAKELGTDEINFMIDSAILGGAIVRSGANEVDASYAHQLNQMRGALLS